MLRLDRCIFGYFRPMIPEAMQPGQRVINSTAATALPYPGYNHLGLMSQVRSRSRVVPVGILAADFEQRRRTSPKNRQPPLIVWNQRWDYDKRPDRFLKLLYRLQTAQACSPALRRHTVEHYAWPVVARLYDEQILEAITEKHASPV